MDKEGDAIHLLFDDGGERAQTLVVAFACTAGPGQRTHLYMNDLVVRCPGRPDVALDMGLGPGNVTLPGDPAHVFGAAIYRGKEALTGVEKCYWNGALGLEVDALPPSCTLVGSGTAASRPLAGNTTPPWTRWPVVTWSIPISDATTPNGRLVCGRHGLDRGTGPGGVTTDYTPFGPEGVGFHRALDCLTGTVDAVVLCGNGRLDPGELCDGGPGCALDCGCPGALVPDGTRGCTACGNGVIEAGEACDRALDESGNCTAACACAGGYAPDDTGGCFFCGDGAVQLNEQCETALDDGGLCDGLCACTGGYLPTPAGGCAFCGDGVHQAALEACDPGIDPALCGPGCACAPGTSPDGRGACDEPE